jgi:hypothetical protein
MSKKNLKQRGEAAKRDRAEQPGKPAVDPEDLSGSGSDSDNGAFVGGFDDEGGMMLTSEGGMFFGDEGVVTMTRAQLDAFAKTPAGRMMLAGGEGATEADAARILRRQQGGAAGKNDDDSGSDGADFDDDEEDDELDTEDLMLMDEMFGGDFERQEQFLQELAALKQRQKQLSAAAAGNTASAAAAPQIAAGGSENGGNGGDDGEDSVSNTSHIDVNFSVDQMIETDVGLVAKYLDGTFLPDTDRSAVDVTKLSAGIQKRGIGTSLVLTEQEEDEDDSDDEVAAGPEKPEEEPYGILSLLRVGAAPDKNGDVIALLESVPARLQLVPGASDAGAATPGSLLKAGNGALVVAQLFSQLPPLLIARLYSCFVQEVTDGIAAEANNKNKKGGAPAAAAGGSAMPTHLVFLSRVAVVPAADPTEDKTCLTSRADETAQSNKSRGAVSGANKKARVEKSADGDGSGNSSGNTFVQFLRYEEEMFYARRDAAATSVLMGRYTNDPADNMRCVVFAIKWSAFCAVVKQIEKDAGVEARA